MVKNSEKVAIVTNFSWIGISSPLINCVSYFLENNISVSFFCDRVDFQRFPLPNYILNHKNFNLIKINGLGRGFIGDIYFSILCSFNFKKFKFVFAIDHQAVLRAYIIAFFAKSTLIYMNLEFLMPNSFFSVINKYREKFVARRSSLIISQDLIRAEWLSNSLNQKIDKFRILFNSPRISNEVKDDPDYFRKKFNISKNKKVVLVTGSLISEHLILEFVKSVHNWDNNFVLILHGWFSDHNYKSEIYNEIVKLPGRIYVSNNIFNDNENLIPYISCDIGLIGYSQESVNHSLVGCASGKFFDFFRTNKPILLFNSIGLNEIVEKHNIGVVISDFSSINYGLNQIVQNYDLLSSNCLHNFLDYEFDFNFNLIYSELDK